MRFSPLLWLVVGLTAGAYARLCAQDTSLQIRRTTVPDAIAQLSTAELIDRLQNEGGEKINLPGGGSQVRFAALELGFAPLDAPPWGVERNWKRYPPSPVMTELVARGLKSLPLLLKHLSDARPTQCTRVVRFMFGGPGGFADKYDSRYRDPERQPKTVNQVTEKTFMAFQTEHYVLRVGDLCYYAVGQIVNRRLNPIDSGMGLNNRALTINSPVESWALSLAAFTEWQGLTAAEHEASLLADSRDDAHPRPRMLGEPGLKRLLFYYPEAGEREAERRLDVPLSDSNLGQVLDLAYNLDAYAWPTLTPVLQRLFQRAIALRGDSPGERLGRDQLVLIIAQRIGGKEFDPELAPFLAAEIKWWEKWQTETAAATWFRKNGPMAGISNLWPDTKRWSADAAKILDAKHSG